MDREAEGTAGEDYVTFLGSNFVEQGRRAGEWLAGQTDGKARIVELTGTPGVIGRGGSGEGLPARRSRSTRG